MALSDTAQKVRRLRDNASDRFLHVEELIDLQSVLQKIPQCQHLVLSGDKAVENLLRLLPAGVRKPSIGKVSAVDYAGRSLLLHRLPSSSRAYPLPLHAKAARYRVVFQEIFGDNSL